MSPRTGPASVGGVARGMIVRLLLFAGLWMVLVEGELRPGVIPVITILAATLTSLSFRTPAPALSVRGTMRFIPYFLVQSFRGGVDVARRAFAPGLPIDPGIERVTLRLPTEQQRAVLAAIVGLLPGTLSVRLDDRQLDVHALNRRMHVGEIVRELEDRLAAVFGVEL